MEKRYSIVFHDNTGSRAVDAIAQTFDGAWSNAVSLTNGVHDMAFVDVPEEHIEALEECLENDDNVVSYKIIPKSGDAR
jgi:histidinol dehydrogenase